MTSEWPDLLGEQDVIINHPSQNQRPLDTRDLPGMVEATVSNLPNNTEITLHVRVLNKKYMGPPSPTVQFQTAEG